MKLFLLVSSLFSAIAFSAEEPLKVTALAQAWMFNDTSVTMAKPNFRLRRGEIRVAGTLNEQIKAFIMIDAAKSIPTTATGTVNTTADGKILQDIGVTITPMDNFDITLGQVKTPTTAEGLESSSELIFPERSIVGRTYGDKREPGGVIAYKRGIIKGTLMISNGQATNIDDIDNNKDLTLRLVADISSDLSVGAFTQAANFSYGERARHGLNVKYQTETFLTRVEGVLQSQNQNTLKSNGFVVDGGYKFDKWQPVARFEMYTPDTNGTQTGKAFSLGLNYYFAQKAKAQFATTAFWDMNANNGALALTTAALGTSGTLMTLAFSAAL